VKFSGYEHNKYTVETNSCLKVGKVEEAALKEPQVNVRLGAEVISCSVELVVNDESNKKVLSLYFLPRCMYPSVA